MASTKRNLTPEQARVDRAIKAVLLFHSIGQASLRTTGERLPYGKANESAKKAHLNPDTLRKARLFAQTYTEGDLRALVRNCQKHQFPLGVSHIIRLVTLERCHRTFVEAQTIARHWSKRQLDEEIRKLHPNRRPSAGRRPRVSESVDGVREQLLYSSRKWRRLHDCISPEAFGQFTQAEQKAIKSAAAAIDRLIVELERNH